MKNLMSASTFLYGIFYFQQQKKITRHMKKQWKNFIEIKQ